jgi:hypothetical protein
MCVYVCLCIPLTVATQRLGKNSLIVARQRLGKNPPIVDRIVGRVVFYPFRVVSRKVGDLFFPELLLYKALKNMHDKFPRNR